MHSNLDVEDRGSPRESFDISYNESYSKSLRRLNKRRIVRSLAAKCEGGLVKKHPRRQGSIIGGDSIVAEI